MLASVCLAVACAVAAVLLLERASAFVRSAPRSRLRRSAMAAAWLCAALGAPAWRATDCGWDKAWALAALAPSLVALAVLAFRAVGAGRPRPAAAAAATVTEAPRSRPHLLRGLVRTTAAGPLAGAGAAAAAAAAYRFVPGSDADRVVAAGLVLPTVWALAATCALCDPHLRRALIALTAVAIAGGAAARL